MILFKISLCSSSRTLHDTYIANGDGEFPGGSANITKWGIETNKIIVVIDTIH